MRKIACEQKLFEQNALETQSLHFSNKDLVKKRKS